MDVDSEHEEGSIEHEGAAYAGLPEKKKQRRKKIFFAKFFIKITGSLYLKAKTGKHIILLISPKLCFALIRLLVMKVFLEGIKQLFFLLETLKTII